MYYNELEKFAQKQEQKLISALAGTREYPSPDGETRSRDSYQRDYVRILYSSSFRRLQGKIRLSEIDPERLNRNGLTYNLEVAQIVRSIASDLKLINPVMVRLTALAHDIRNLPFGHSDEKLPNELSEEIGGYESNVQVLRILRKLEKKLSYCSGLNLAHHSLLSIAKYPVPRVAATANKFIYDDDYYFYINLLAENQLDLDPGKEIVDARMMDLAGKIACAAHDLGDALSGSMVTIEDIKYELQISDESRGTREQFREIVTQSRNTAFQANLLKTSEEFAIIFYKELTPNIVNRLIVDISVVTSLNGSQGLGFGKLNVLPEGLKKPLSGVVMQKHSTLTYEFREDKVIKDLYDSYNEGENYKLLPSEFKFILPQSDPCIFKIGKERAVINYISGVMDTFAAKEWGTHCLK